MASDRFSESVYYQLALQLRSGQQWTCCPLHPWSRCSSLNKDYQQSTRLVLCFDIPLCCFVSIMLSASCIYRAPIHAKQRLTQVAIEHLKQNRYRHKETLNVGKDEMQYHLSLSLSLSPSLPLSVCVCVCVCVCVPHYLRSSLGWSSL